MILYPHIAQRVACLAPGMLVIIAGAAAAGGGMVAIGSGAVAIGVVLIVRAWRMGVVCEATRIVVRGQLWSTAIPLKSVVEIGRTQDVTLIRWRHPSTGNRRTLVTAFTSAPAVQVLPFIEQAQNTRVTELRDWVRINR